MRASRLLQILLILQNRGRQTAPALAAELEVAPRTILRDVDAMTEAGLPIIVHRGNQGGIELGFNYRTRLTGLASDEAEALGVILGRAPVEADALGLAAPARRAAAKLIESLPDTVRTKAETARNRHPITPAPFDPDPRVVALAEAIRNNRHVTLAMRSKTPIALAPKTLGFDGTTWWVSDGETMKIPQKNWGDINISRKPFPQNLA